MIVLMFSILVSCTSANKNYDREPSGKYSDVFDEKAWEIVPIGDLKDDFDTLYVMSDIHGQLRKLISLLKEVKLITDAPSKWYQWNPAAKKKMFVVLGDAIDKGVDSIGVVRLLSELEEQAPKYGSRVIYIMGNHEVEYLAEPVHTIKKEDINDEQDVIRHREWLDSVLKKKAGFGKKISAKEFKESAFGAVIEDLKIGAIIGRWFFSHAGFFDVKNDASDIVKYIGDISKAYEKGDFATLSQREGKLSAPIARHNWFRKPKKKDDPDNMKKLRNILDKLELDGVVFGHDPDAFEEYRTGGVMGEIAAGPGDWAIKTDSAMSNEAKYGGRILECNLKKAFYTKSEELHMKLLDRNAKKIKDGGNPICSQWTSQSKQDILYPDKN